MSEDGPKDAPSKFSDNDFSEEESTDESFLVDVDKISTSTDSDSLTQSNDETAQKPVNLPSETSTANRLSTVRSVIGMNRVAQPGPSVINNAKRISDFQSGLRENVRSDKGKEIVERLSSLNLLSALAATNNTTPSEDFIRSHQKAIEEVENLLSTNPEIPPAESRYIQQKLSGLISALTNSNDALRIALMKQMPNVEKAADVSTKPKNSPEDETASASLTDAAAAAAAHNFPLQGAAAQQATPSRKRQELNATNQEIARWRASTAPQNQLERFQAQLASAKLAETQRRMDATELANIEQKRAASERAVENQRTALELARLKALGESLRPAASSTGPTVAASSTGPIAPTTANLSAVLNPAAQPSPTTPGVSASSTSVEQSRTNFLQYLSGYYNALGGRTEEYTNRNRLLIKSIEFYFTTLELSKGLIGGENLPEYLKALYAHIPLKEAQEFQNQFITFAQAMDSQLQKELLSVLHESQQELQQKLLLQQPSQVFTPQATAASQPVVTPLLSSAPASPSPNASAPKISDIAALEGELKIPANKEKWGVVGHERKGNELIVKMADNKGLAVVTPNKQGGFNYGIRKGAKNEDNISGICKMAVDTAAPDTVFDLSKTPPKQQAQVFAALTAAIKSAKDKGEKTNLPTIVGYEQPAEKEKPAKPKKK